MSSCFLRLCFFQPFPFPFPLLKFVSFYLASFFLESKPKAFQRISFSQAKKTWMIMIHNSMVCLRVHYCVQLLPEVILFFNIPFTFSFAKVFFYFLNEFLLFRILRNAQFPKIYDALLKPNLKTSLKQFFKGVVHEQPWYTIVWFVWGYTIVSSCFLRWFFFNHFLYLFLC